jgi:hypothetical protein
MDEELLRASEQLIFGVTGALTARPLLEKLLGRSFEYVGQAMADLLARYGNKNVRDIFGRTAARLQDSEAAVGTHPRVLKTVIEEGSFATDEAAQEYFAGLLASSLSAGSENDEAITFLNLVRNLSVAEIKLHHLIYSLKRILHNPKYFPPIPADVSGELFLPHQLLVEQAGIHTVPARRHALHGLVQQGLISPSFDASSRSFDPSQQGTFDGITLAGTDFGAELFLWVHGQEAPRRSRCARQLRA